MGKIIDVTALEAWIRTNQRDEGSACPIGQHWDSTTNTCVPDVHACPVGQHWDSVQNMCVPDVTGPVIPSNWDQQTLIRPLWHLGQQWGFFGYNRAADGVDFPFGSNKTYFFLLDPKKTDKTGRPAINCGDANQSIACKVEAWTLDANYNKVFGPIPFVGGNASMSIQWPKAPANIWVAGQCILVQVTTTVGFPGIFFWQ